MNRVFLVAGIFILMAAVAFSGIFLAHQQIEAGRGQNEIRFALEKYSGFQKPKIEISGIESIFLAGNAFRRL